MAADKKKLLGIGVFVIFVTGLVWINHRISGQIRSLDQPAGINAAAKPSSLEVVKEEGPRLPVIDPHNDPLAPRARKNKERPAPPAVTSRAPAKIIYESPTDDVILVQ